MDRVRQAGRDRGFSEESAELLTKGWRNKTRTAYNANWRTGERWCNQQQTDPLSASIPLIADFLTSQYNEGKQYSTLNAYRSTISSIHPEIDGGPIGQHRDIKRLMEGMFNERPPQPKYTETWDVQTVLSHIKTLGPNATMHIRDLAQKLAALIAITAASRASGIQNLSTKHMTDGGNTITFKLSRPTKVTKQGEPLPTIVIHAYDKDRDLDPTECIRAYLHRTKEWRLKEEQDILLLSTIKPHNPVATPTVSNWIKQIMKKAGIDTDVYTAHSTRSASTSKAKQTGLPISDIIHNANWSRATTFHRHYHKQVVDKSVTFSSTVLDTSHQC